MQELQPPVVLVGLDNDFIVHGHHHGRGVLSDAVELHFHALELELDHGRNALDTFDHAGCNRSKKEFNWIKGIRPALDIGIEREVSLFG